PRGQIAVRLLDGGFWKRLHDLTDGGHHLLLGDAKGETDVGFEGGARGYHVDLGAAPDGANVERDLVDDGSGSWPHGAIHGGTSRVDGTPEIVGELRLDVPELLERGRDRHGRLGGTLAGMGIGAVGTRRVNGDFEPERAFLTEAYTEGA